MNIRKINRRLEKYVKSQYVGDGYAYIDKIETLITYDGDGNILVLHINFGNKADGSGWGRTVKITVSEADGKSADFICGAFSQVADGNLD